MTLLSYSARSLVFSLETRDIRQDQFMRRTGSPGRWFANISVRM